MTGWPAWLFSLFSRRAVAAPVAIPQPSLQTYLLQVAGAEIGVRETTRNRGPEIGKYWQATTYPDGMEERQPWCAAFLAWCVREAIIRRWGREGEAPFKRCKSARVADWLAWARREPGVRIVRDPRPGDLAIYVFSHCGIVSDYRAGDDFDAIEGNTDDSGGREGVEVAVRRRQRRQVEAFMRLPV